MQDRRVTGHEHMFASRADNYTRRLNAHTDSGAKTAAMTAAQTSDWMTGVATGTADQQPAAGVGQDRHRVDLRPTAAASRASSRSARTRC